ncbi:MAG: hypothetical protein ACHP84_11360 [Caulobacterales bacterium]
MFSDTKSLARGRRHHVGLLSVLAVMVGLWAAAPSLARAASLTDPPELAAPPALSDPTASDFAATDAATTDGAAGASASDDASADNAVADSTGSDAQTSDAAADPMAAAFEDPSAFKPMDNKEMGEARGGFDGVAFGIFLNGTITQQVPPTLPPGITVTTTPNSIQVIGAFGNFAGANGIFQLTNVNGNFNVINNNIIINVIVQPQSPTNAAGLF